MLLLLLMKNEERSDYSRSDGINVNLWWGLVMTVFGLLMSLVGSISSRRKAY